MIPVSDSYGLRTSKGDELSQPPSAESHPGSVLCVCPPPFLPAHWKVLLVEHHEAERLQERSGTSLSMGPQATPAPVPCAKESWAAGSAEGHLPPDKTASSEQAQEPMAGSSRENRPSPGSSEPMREAEWSLAG